MHDRMIRQGLVALAVALAIGTPTSWAGHNGKHVYKKTCVKCHHYGVGGAPVFGDDTAWQPRIAQGKDALYRHALHGFKGMPARGADPGLSDNEVRSAVDYMVGQVTD